MSCSVVITRCSEKLDYISKSQSAEFTKIRDILTLVAPPVTLLSQGPFSSHQALGAILQPKYTSPLLRRKGSSRDPRNTVQQQRSVWQTPTYIFGRIWEIQLSKATSGWTWTINPYNVIADNAIAIRYAQNGDIAALLGLFAAGQASISDRDYRFGASLLHVSTSSCSLAHFHATKIDGSMRQSGASLICASSCSLLERHAMPQTAGTGAYTVTFCGPSS